MRSCFVLIGTHQHCVAKMPCVPQRIGPCSQTVSNLDPKFYTKAPATRIQECILFYLTDNTTYEHMHPTLGKERDCSQSFGPKMNVLEMGLIKVCKSRQNGLVMKNTSYSFPLLTVNKEVLCRTY